MERRNPPASGESSRPDPQQKPYLSCELCRDRKVKCDKLDPCTNCVSHGVVCKPVKRLRLPRGRHATRTRQNARGNDGVSEDVNHRIHRLEALIDEMRTKSVSATPEGPGSSESQPINPPAVSIVSSNPAKGGVEGASSTSSQTSKETNAWAQRPESFWEKLASEIHGLRDVVESALDDAEDDSAQAPAPAHGNSIARLMAPISLSNPTSVSHSSIESSNWPLDSVKSQLCQIYLAQVDPIIKILHRTSLEKWLVRGEGYFEYPDHHPTLKALSTAVYFAAVSSLSEQQCFKLFQSTRSSLVTRCREECEIAIERSGLLATRDINVLQAFVLYLYARRIEDRSKAVWTLVAVAVRIARGLGLHLPTQKQTESFFRQQMRLRLWLTLSLLDMQSTFIQATEPLITRDEVASSLALLRHINDSDFDRTTAIPVNNREDLTDMTFALVTYHLQVVGRVLNFVGDDAKDAVNTSSVSDSDIRQQYARQFEDNALRLLRFCDPESSSRAWMTWHGTQCLVAGIRLTLARPLHGAPAPTPRMNTNAELLRMRLEVLEKTHLMLTDPRAESFRWYVAVPWHVVAMAIAECYVCTDAALIRRAWPVIEALYQQHEALIARHSGGVLRGPLGKLMRKTREKVQAVVDSSEVMDTSPAANTGGSAGVPGQVIEGSQPVANFLPSTMQDPAPIWDFTTLPQDIQAIPGGTDTVDESWNIWDSLMSEIPWDDIDDFGSFSFRTL